MSIDLKLGASACCGAIALLVTIAAAQPPATKSAQPAATPAPGKTPAPAAAKSIGAPPGDLTPRDGEHPLAPLIRWGKAGMAALAELDDYSCRLAKRERIGGQLGDHQWMSIKLRHRPFSVYASFLNRQEQPWQEVIYIDGRHNGKMFVHSDEHRLMGTVSLFPDSSRALRESRYPVTEVGIHNLIQRLVERAESDLKFDDCEVKIYNDAKIESRPCLYVRVTHKTRRPEFSFHLARIFIDNELNVPVRYEAYTWPEEADGKPVLQEEYTYLDFQFNRRFVDRDFDINNPDYKFPPDYDDPKVDLAGVVPVAQEPAAGDKTAPLAGVITQTREALARVEEAADYACLLSQRTGTGGEPSKYEHMLLRVRQKPVSVYAFFLGPQTPRGEEAIFVADSNGGQALMHTAPLRGQPAVTRKLPLKSPELVRAGGAPFDELGLKPRLSRWLAMWEAELPHGDCSVRSLSRVKVDQETANCLEVTHPTAQPHFRYHLARLYFDDETKLPVRFEAYGWPVAGQPAPLLEEFNYRDLETNRGFTDEDFDPANPSYTFGHKQ